MHHGAAKTWYGVPGSDALKFEEVFQSEVRERPQQPVAQIDLEAFRVG